MSGNMRGDVLLSFRTAVEKKSKDTMAMVCGMSAWKNRPHGRKGRNLGPNPLMRDRRRYRHSQLPN